MSLKHNPFDQTPKGNLVKRRKVFESPTSAESIQTSDDVVSEKRSPNSVETVSERSPELGLNSVGTESKRSLNGVENFDPAILIGREKQLLIFLFSECQRTGSLRTDPLTVERIRESLDVSTDAVKTATKRLISKGIISRSFRKNGRSGWVQYALPKTVHEKLLYLETVSKRSLNSVGTVSERRPEWGSEQGLNASSSSSILYNKETTTTGTVENFDFNMEPVAEFGLTASAISRCLELYPTIDREKIQDLINRFGQFMRTGEGKRVQNARGFFISLAKQLSEGITPLDHIETSEARLMRELVAKKRAQQAEVEQLEKEMRDFDFEEWWEELAPAERDALVKPNGVSPSGSNSQKIMAKQVHAEKFWPERKKQALSGAAAAEV
jgi:hypothetical protein